MVHANEVLWQGENGGTTRETSHQCCIMRKGIHKEVGAGGRFDFFLDSASNKAPGGLIQRGLICKSDLLGEGVIEDFRYSQLNF